MLQRKYTYCPFVTFSATIIKVNISMEDLEAIFSWMKMGHKMVSDVNGL